VVLLVDLNGAAVRVRNHDAASPLTFLMREQQLAAEIPQGERGGVERGYPQADERRPTAAPWRTAPFARGGKHGNVHAADIARGVRVAAPWSSSSSGTPRAR